MTLHETPDGSAQPLLRSDAAAPPSDSIPSTAGAWRQRVAEGIDPALAEEIAVYETQIELRRTGQLDEKVFAETRLRRGVYGQRYDNGQRHDGFRVRSLDYPSSDVTKGPSTLWDAPGMMRIKIPYGALDATQLEVLADLAEEYSDSVLHVTTRQDVQFHFVHIDDTPDLMWRLGAVGITTREACGNSVRNVTACPLAGVCTDEPFDVSPYAQALTHYLLGHKDAQDFGRKVKIAFSGCAQHACGLASMHDMGLVARTRTSGGREQRGFEFYVGGGLGAVPHQAKLLSDFVNEEDLLPTAQAICRIFARLGEKRNRSRARLKFLVAKLGIEVFRELVDEELRAIPHDDRWVAYLDDLDGVTEAPTREPSPLDRTSVDDSEREAFGAWFKSNAVSQRQSGYVAVSVVLPLGDLTALQTRQLAEITRKYNGGHVRLTVDQNIVLRNIAEGDLPDLWRELVLAGLGQAGAGALVDVTSCPGTDTCKLGISASRGLASELRRQAQLGSFVSEEAVQALRIKVSGCFNSCGQHHVADIGFYGVSRKHQGRAVPHFQVVLGGQWTQNAGAYGLAIVAVPSKRIPEVVNRLTRFFVAEREARESFQSFVARIGKARLRAQIDDLTQLPDYEMEPDLFSDWRDPREFTIGDLGVGECAGEVVSVVEFGLADSERKAFEAQLHYDRGDVAQAGGRAYEAMLEAARALVLLENVDVSSEPDDIVSEFRSRYFDTERFFDPFAGGKFGNYLLAAHEAAAQASFEVRPEGARQRIEEAQLFIEAAHSCYQRLGQESVA